MLLSDTVKLYHTFGVITSDGLFVIPIYPPVNVPYEISQKVLSPKLLFLNRYREELKAPNKVIALAAGAVTLV